MSKKKTIIATVLTVSGFLLSPLSWWNDLLINIPLAYAISAAVSLVIPGHFAMVMIIVYWLTNVAGLVLMHRGGSLYFEGDQPNYTVRSVIKDLSISALYSLLIGLLVVTGILKVPEDMVTWLK